MRLFRVVTLVVIVTFNEAIGELEYMQLTESKVADHNFRAVLDFFDKYPQYKDRDFFIAGESYGGIYVPTLSQRVVKSQNAGEFPGKFKGMAIGNGMLSAEYQQDSLVHLQYYRGVIGYEDWDDINEKCCGSTNTTCNYFQSLKRSGMGYISDGTPCGDKTVYVSEQLVGTAQNDAYNQYQDCYNPTGGKADRLAQTMRTFFPFFPWPARRSMRNRDPWWAHGRSHHGRRSHGHHHSPSRHDDEESGEDPINYDSTDALSGFPCWMDNGTMEYVNSFLTKLAIHVRRDHAPEKWTTCNDAFETGSYDRTYFEMDNVFQYILNNSDARILIYNGDVDSVCNFLGDEWFIRRVTEENDIPMVQKRQKWVYRGRIAGYVKKFPKIDLLTIKGAGHFVPTDRAGPALQMFANFLANSSYNTEVPASTRMDEEAELLSLRGRAESGFWETQAFFMQQPRQSQQSAASIYSNFMQLQQQSAAKSTASPQSGAAVTGILVGVGLIAVIAVALIGYAAGRRYQQTRVGYNKL